MNRTDVHDSIWKFMQQRLNYNGDELEKFRRDPRWQKILQGLETVINKTIVFEVIKSHGCNVEHAVGDKFFFAAEGYMLAHKGPKKVCPYLMPAMTRMMAIIQERLYEGLDPRPFFYRGHCDDIGLDCGGWGEVLIEASILERNN